MTERYVKICLIGDGRVGKTSLRKRFMGHGFTKSHLMTIGADFGIKSIKLGNEIVSLQIWDLAGQESFQNVRMRFYLNSEGIIFVYDVTNKSSLENMVKWIAEMWKVTKNENIPVVVVGNKIDLKEQKVITKEMYEYYIELMRKRYNKVPNVVFYCETSAKTGEGVDQAFIELAKSVYKQESNN